MTEDTSTQTTKAIMKKLEFYKTKKTKRIYLNQGAKEPLFGVRVGDLKKIIRETKIKNNHTLALELYETGNYDAMFLAGLIASSVQMTKDEIYNWLEKAYCHVLYDCTVAALVSESPFALELAREFISSSDNKMKSCGYSIYSYYVSIKKDEELDLEEIKSILINIKNTINKSENNVICSMNNFIISVGTSILDMYDFAVFVSREITLGSDTSANEYYLKRQKKKIR